jgi:hypothetical protein
MLVQPFSLTSSWRAAAVLLDPVSRAVLRADRGKPHQISPALMVRVPGPSCGVVLCSSEPPQTPPRGSRALICYGLRCQPRSSSPARPRAAPATHHPAAPDCP